MKKIRKIYRPDVYHFPFEVDFYKKHGITVEYFWQSAGR